MAGLLYVVYNESIRDTETNERLYKIGITKNSVSDRYYGLGLKMPGKFETLFAYKLNDYAKAEQLIHTILAKYRKNGEWFNLNQKELDHIKTTCELMDGIIVTDEIKKELEESISMTQLTKHSTDINGNIFVKKQSEEMKNSKETLPILDVYDFLESKGLGNKAKEIKSFGLGNTKTKVRRGYFLVMFDGNPILDEFIEKYWSYGNTKSGKTKIEYYKRKYYEKIT